MILFVKYNMIFLRFIISTILLFVLYSMAAADDYSTPHRFQAGDVISADIMNELFEYIQNSKNTVTEESIVGTWTCDSYIHYQQHDNAVAGWVLDSDNMFARLEASTITFDQNGTSYSLTTSAPNPLNSDDLNKLDAPFKIVGDSFFFSYDSGGGVIQAPIYSIKKICKTRFKLTITSAGGQCPRIVFCNKENLPPANPLNLSATKSGLTIFLNWVDNSNDETGFEIIRRNGIERDYDQIGTTGADATSLSDTVPAPGVYWYRVKAVNAHGNSFGSNVVKVTINQ